MFGMCREHQQAEHGITFAPVSRLPSAKGAPVKLKPLAKGLLPSRGLFRQGTRVPAVSSLEVVGSIGFKREERV